MIRRTTLVATALALSCAAAAESMHVYAIAQKDRAFSLSTLTIAPGDTIRFTNEDGFLHQIFVHSPGLTVDSDEQRPGQNVDVLFPVAGTFHVLCAIHPKMALQVDVR